MKIGYARVSTEEQNLEMQRAALQAAKCDRIFEDRGVSGASTSRPGLDQALGCLKPGDRFVVWKLDRLGRSLLHLIETINELATRNVDFCSLTENIDTGSPGGRLVFHMMGAMAEFERSLISERTKAGMQIAQQQGRHVGRPPALTTSQREEIVAAVTDHGTSVRQMAQIYKVHPQTIRRVLRVHTEESNTPLPETGPTDMTNLRMTEDWGEKRLT